jgi:diguanylate cyclase (GGDEF)-like protein/PAS domain S-box-containing protein
MASDSVPASQILLSHDVHTHGRAGLHLPAALLTTIRAGHHAPDDRQLNQRIQGMLDRLGVGLFRMTTSGWLLECSPRFREILGLPADVELDGYNLFDFFVRREPDAVQTRSQRTGQIHAREVQLRCLDGRVIWIELTETPQPGGQGEDIVEGLAEEVTDRKRLEEAMWLGEEYFRVLVENSSQVVMVLDTDGTVRYANARVSAVLGYQAGELLGASAFELVHPLDQDALRRAFAQPEGAAGRPQPCEFRLQRRTGGWATFDALLQNLLDDPVVAGLVVRARDVPGRSGRRRSRDESQRLQLALDAAGTGVWELNTRSGRLRGSASMSALVGRPGRAYHGTYGEFLKCVHPADLDEVSERVAQAIDEDRDFALEFRLIRPDGATRWLCAKGKALRNRHGTVTRLVGTAVDETERKLAQDKLLHDAFHDSLTGLSNRALFVDRLNHTVAVADRHPGFHFGVLIVDLDHFKHINDSLGHLVGDQLLIAAARRLERCLRPGDTVTRWGGDEFTVLLNDLSDSRDATRVADRILREMRVPFSVEGHEVSTSASIGIAFSATGFGRPDDLLRNADTALYRAKMRGRNRYEAFDQEMHRRAMSLIQLEADLRRAVEREEMSVHYQPIVSLSTGTIGGFEALIRWNHATRGTLAPTEFISIAEDAGLMLDLDRWVLGEACRQLHTWTDRYPGSALQISVNLSGRDFTHPELVDRIRTILEETGLEGRNLKVELGERVLLENRDAAKAVLRQLKELGVGVQIDNFGTGTSGVTSLHQYPIDAFKIDRSLIGRLGTDPRAAGIIRALVDLAHNLGMTVIAEGIETDEQLRVLREVKCDFAQGFLFARPADSRDCDVLLAGSPSW